MMGALPFLPVEDVDRAWRFLKPTLPTDMKYFTKYFEDTWIGTSKTAPLFNQWYWHQHDFCFAGLPCSSNIADEWHNRYKASSTAPIRNNMEIPGRPKAGASNH